MTLHRLLLALIATVGLVACSKSAPAPPAETTAVPTAPPPAGEAPPAETTAPPAEDASAPGGGEAAAGAVDEAACTAAYDNLAKVTIDDQLGRMDDLPASSLSEIRQQVTAGLEAGRASFASTCKMLPAAAVRCLTDARTTAALAACVQAPDPATPEQGDDGDAAPTGRGPVADEPLCKEAYARIVKISIGEQLGAMRDLPADEQGALTAKITASMEAGEKTFVTQCVTQPASIIRCMSKAEETADFAACAQ